MDPERDALKLGALPPEELPAALTERFAAALKLEGDALTVALHEHALLVTELRELGVWPRRRDMPECW